ncbi:putative spindle assembly checkpoint kinase [Diaporthe ampelina]|uniref:EKC/KEOPS complex subunit BUD32 n=1 Tax=Diaporthe ampelina TaxID=1214573 RepID=A0A0G2HPP1_9PEZI|nr:putative spindle assembly checkpoint kinase [Diaporthe ampelina]
MSSDGTVQYPSGFSLKDLVGWGANGLVVHDESNNTIIKTPFAEENTDHIAREKQVYERFTERGGHKGILRYHGPYETGIRLDYAPNHNLRGLIDEETSQQQRLDWAIQIAEAVEFIHASGVIHGDMTCANIFVDEGLNAKVADFAGSSLDGSELLIVVTASHAYPGELQSVRADLFALGGILYELMTGQPPYDGKEDEEIEELYKSHVFPDTESLGSVGRIIMKCWQGGYADCKPIVEDLKSTIQC